MPVCRVSALKLPKVGGASAALGQLTAPLEEQRDPDAAASCGDEAQRCQQEWPVEAGGGGRFHGVRPIVHRLQRLEGSPLENCHIPGLVQRDPADCTSVVGGDGIAFDIAAGGAAVAGYLHLHRIQPQSQRPGEAVVGDERLLLGQQSQHRGHVLVFTVQRHRLGVLAALMLRKFLLEQIHQGVVVSVLLEIRAGDAGGVVLRGQVVELADLSSVLILGDGAGVADHIVAKSALLRFRLTAKTMLAPLLLCSPCDPRCWARIGYPRPLRRVSGGSEGRSQRQYQGADCGQFLHRRFLLKIFW